MVSLLCYLCLLPVPAGARGGGKASLLNIIGELKKCCNHPFLFESAEDNYRGSENDRTAVDRLTVTSGKMVLLDKLLRRLKDTGHRVLLFSQVGCWEREGGGGGMCPVCVQSGVQRGGVAEGGVSACIA